MKNAVQNKYCSPEAIKRLALYLRGLKTLRGVNVKIISSEDITKILDVSACQFRKDLSFFGGFGKRGVGYEVDVLSREIERILGVNKNWPIALVGVGKLGGALLGFPGFSKFNLRILAAYDSDKKKIGKIVAGVKIEDVKKLKESIKEKKIKIGMICIPVERVQKVAEDMVRAGIKAMLNFAPVNININRKDVYISNMDMAAELESLIYFIK
ncbi:MAG: redox-sensing transcriptional repressor Rex [Candidatus Omnitrophica bacterium]|nr:redox-sensing transcriptional repressor Rex [Candidatus Omnitrophota bacterium]